MSHLPKTPYISPTITGDEIAALLGVKPDTFRHRRAKLIAAGMPRPIPLPGMHARWSRANILAWIDRNADGDLPPSFENHDDIEDIRAGLEARIGGAS